MSTLHSSLEWKIPCTQAIYCLGLGKSYLLVQLMMGLINELMNVIQDPLLLLSIDCKLIAKRFWVLVGLIQSPVS